jgi:hypothetical protein
MSDRGRLTAPGSPLNAAVLAPESGTLVPPPGDLAEMAAQYGLRPSSARPSLASYLALVWQRRYFIVAYATARNVAMYTEARLGHLWQVLTPLLNPRPPGFTSNQAEREGLPRQGPAARLRCPACFSAIRSSAVAAAAAGGSARISSRMCRAWSR